MGPPLPAWFEPRVNRVDPHLVCQFMVPDYMHPRGVAREIYPFGVWTIVRRLPHSGWLLVSKFWAHSLNNEAGLFRVPSMTDIDLIRLARGLWERGRNNELADELDRSFRALQKEKSERSRNALLSRIGDRMRQLGLTQHGESRVSLYGANPCGN